MEEGGERGGGGGVERRNDRDIKARWGAQDKEIKSGGTGGEEKERVGKAYYH